MPQDDETLALDDLHQASVRVNQGFRDAANEAAGNLLTKALARLGQGDDAGARSLVRRALAVPYDGLDVMQPAPWWPHVRLYVAIAEDLERREPGDAGYLDRVDALLETCGPVAAQEVRISLRYLLNEVYALPEAEKARIKAIMGDVPIDSEPLRGVPDDETLRTAAIIETLQALRQHQQLCANA